MRQSLLIRFAGFFSCFFSHAALATTTSSPVFDLSQLHRSGYIGTSYNYLVRSNHFTSGALDRYNDLTENGFTLQQAAVTLGYQPKQGFGGLFNAIVGRDAKSLAPYGWNPYFGSQTLQLVIPNAFLQFATGRYTFVGGIFDTEVGEELYDPTKNTNFSRSILSSYAEPSFLMGVRTYIDVDRVRVNAGINNGWSGIADTNRQLAYELGADITFNPAFILRLQGLFSEQRLVTLTSTGPTGRRQYFDIIAKYKATDALTLIALVDYGVQSKAALANGTIGRAVWQGVSGYLNYQLMEKWLASLRGEIYADSDGYTTGVNQNLREVTLTLGYQPVKAWIIRAETRHDFSNVNAFVNRSAPGASNNQQSFALEVLYQF